MTNLYHRRTTFARVPELQLAYAGTKRQHHAFAVFMGDVTRFAVQKLQTRRINNARSLA